MNERVDDATLAFMESGYRAMSNTERSLHQRDVMLCLAELRRLRAITTQGAYVQLAEEADEAKHKLEAAKREIERLQDCDRDSRYVSYQWQTRAEEAEDALRAWRNSDERPADGSHVAYLFEPFGGYYVGIYDAASDSVAGRSGFTTWQPEVIAWFPLPPRLASPPIEGTVTDAPPEPEVSQFAVCVKTDAEHPEVLTHTSSVYETPKPLTQSEQNTSERKP